MMAKAAGLTGELQARVRALEDDLRARVDGPDAFARQEGVYDEWHEQHTEALKAQRTAASWQQWRDERVTQAAAAWVLLTVFARFCEDNALVSRVWIAGPDRARRNEALDARRAYFQANPEHNDRHWLNQIVQHFTALRATAGLVDDYSPLHLVSPSGDAARRLLEFWWDQDSEGELRHRFTDLDTRFLGDLYQDLSEDARDRYAMLQTPEFVEEFILDHTMEPALAERPLEGFSVIDPACGSGHFLLGAFRRLLDRWSRHAPALETRALVQKALDGVHGVDINPFAVAIARFRLLVAALRASGETTLERVPDFHVQLAAGDSLIYGAEQLPLFSYATENRELLAQVLQDRYDVVVGNPPYITAKADPAQNSTYRTLYHYCKGTYALTVPFMELMFNLARSGERPGWTGQITSNSFMKREFGKPLIEKFLASRDLRAVVDTSGVPVPGHGTATLILVGRNQRPVTPTVRSVLSVRGEDPANRSTPERGFVWRSIAEHVDKPGFEDDWITVADLDRGLLAQHPWSLSGGGAVELSARVEGQTHSLDESDVVVGRTTHTGADDAFYLPASAARTLEVGSETVPVVLGEDVRDFSIGYQLVTLFPYDESGEPVPALAAAYHVFWRNRTLLASRVDYQQTLAERGLRWFDHSMFFKARYVIPLGIAFAFVATHNHFILDRGGKVFNRSAPVIKLPEGATEDDHLKLLGVLNSSVACFWLKQNSFDKGTGGINEGTKDESWERFYEFTTTTLKNVPLPATATLPLTRARRLDSLAQQLARHTPQAVCDAAAPTKAALDAAHAEHDRIRSQMIAEQEELDWECYRLYGLIDGDLTYHGELPGLALGERAFEVVLARAMENGEDTAWFSRHGSTPVTTLPAHWPADYRALVQRKLDLIEADRNIRLLEKPEYKRRWAIEPWDKRVQAALKDWLLDRLEDRELWFDLQGRPRPRSVAQLADLVGRDEEFTGVLALWTGNRDTRVATALGELLKDQAVPYLAAYRYKESGMEKRAAWEETWRLQRKEDAGEKLDRPIPVPPKYAKGDFARGEYWTHRGKLDVPKERFISYPDAGRDADPTPLLGWAGWDHAQQALALATIANEREQDGWPDERMVPLVAGLAELAPWVRQWHSDVDPTYGVSLAAFIEQELDARRQRAGVSPEDLSAWRPPKAGRKRTTAKHEETLL